MLRCGGKFGFALVLAAACALLAAVCIAQTPPQAPPTKASESVKPKPRGKKSVPVAEVPPTPPPPPTLEEQPPAAPQVTYRDGQLTIDSRNATLSQVLHSVQAQTGASVDLPPGAGTERVGTMSLEPGYGVRRNPPPPLRQLSMRVPSVFGHVAARWHNRDVSRAAG